MAVCHKEMKKGDFVSYLIGKRTHYGEVQRLSGDWWLIHDKHCHKIRAITENHLIVSDYKECDQDVEAVFIRDEYERANP